PAPSCAGPSARRSRWRAGRRSARKHCTTSTACPTCCSCSRACWPGRMATARCSGATSAATPERPCRPTGYPARMLVFTHPACLQHDPGGGHPECPARLQGVLDALKAAYPDQRDWREAPPAKLGELARVHDSELIDLVLKPQTEP